MKLVRSILFTSWIQHLVFWVLSIYFIGSYFSISNELKIIDFVYSGFFHIPLLWIVYWNLNYQIPYFFQKERYLIYMVLSVVNIGSAYLLHQLVFDILIPVLPTDFYMVSFTEPSVLFFIFAIYLIITALLRLSKSWYRLQQVKKEKLSLELHALKMQINPHFLFNSLNGIYSLARKKSDKTPKVVLHLSDLMRYMIYEVKDDQVPLSREIEAITNYIALQKIRLEDETVVSFSQQIFDEHKTVAPLLFFPLIENSFKHGLKSENKKNYVDLSLTSDEQAIVFRIKNNKSLDTASYADKYGGIGLKNVQKRLHLIYEEKAELKIEDTEDFFEATLTIRDND